MANRFDLDAYFRRIEYGGSSTPELGTLRAIHRRHVDAIPFENLDPLTGRPVVLDLPALESKLLRSRRGGYCFEQNLLFKAALETLGFSVTGLAARVRWRAPPDGPLGPRSHMLLRVDLADGPYVADVGFGGQLLDEPLRLRVDVEQRTAAAVYQVTRHGEDFALSTELGSDWHVMFLFSLEPQLPADYEVGNWFTSTHPESWFTRRLLIERLTGGARYTLSNTRLTERRRDGRVVERALASAAEVAEVLDGLFGLEPPVPVEAVYAKIAAG